MVGLAGGFATSRGTGLPGKMFCLKIHQDEGVGMADVDLAPAPAPRYSRRHRLSPTALLRGAPTAPSRGTKPTHRRSAAEFVGSTEIAEPIAPAHDVAAAAIEACARALEAWAELSQRADLMHNAAATLRRTKAAIVAEALIPAG
jgi:hypothetical protein